MICIGFAASRKLATVGDYVAAHAIAKVVVLSPAHFPLAVPEADQVEYAEIVMYRTFYRMLQQIGPRTLVVVHECLRTQDRNDLTYNCIRHFLAQTEHVLVFQTRPLIDTLDDFMVLFDFATRSRWRREPFSSDLLREAVVQVELAEHGVDATAVAAGAKLHAKYAAEKRRLIDGIGLGDPHTIPRNLHLIGAPARAGAIEPGRQYVARNGRYKRSNVTTYAEVAGPATVLDFPHRFVDWSDFLTTSGQSRVEAVVSDLRVDAWYLDRFRAWAQRVNDAQATLLGQDLPRRGA